MSARRCDVLIVGAGFAGAATAYHLSRELDGSIVIVEAEKLPGAHASGRNASLLLQAVADPAIRRAAAASRAAYEARREAVGLRQIGSLMVGPRARLERLREPERIASRLLGPAEAVRLVPALAGLAFEAALLTPSDGVIDPWALLNVYLDGARGRGAELVLEAEVREIAHGDGFRVTTTQGAFEAGCLVNAAGAWAGRVAALAGLAGAPPLTPLKRHLFVLDGIAGVAADAPFAWCLEPEIYFRHESGGLLVSVCDEETSASLAETVSPGISETLAELAARHLPRFAEARIRSLWSCFRTKADDGRFVIGRHPSAPGFVWVAGLGGHGMGCSWEIGRLAAEAVLGHRPPELEAFAPARFELVGVQ